MVPDSNQPASEGPDEGHITREDGGTTPGFDEAALYTVVRGAVKDALLDVIGTLLLVGIAFVLVVAGGQMLVASVTPVGTAVGVAVAAIGLYLAAATLELIPPIRDWV